MLNLQLPQRAAISIGFSLLLYTTLLLASSASNEKNRQILAAPNQFELGIHSFIDFGPPFDFYELYIVRPTSAGSRIERITLTPAGDECVLPAKIEASSAVVGDSIATLLESRNPCTISEKTLRRELKRKKNTAVFSGANIALQVPCRSGTRLIRSDILDKDMFDPDPKTPKNTSWTMRLIQKMQQAVGPGVLETTNIFPLVPPGESTDKILPSAVIEDLKAGAFNGLFPGAPGKVSEIYIAAQKPMPSQSVQLVEVRPIKPDLEVLPKYPPIARMAHVEGPVAFTFEIDGNGKATKLNFTKGSPLLQGVVREAVDTWKFQVDARGQTGRATIEFSMNCTKIKK